MLTGGPVPHQEAGDVSLTLLMHRGAIKGLGSGILWSNMTKTAESTTLSYPQFSTGPNYSSVAKAI